MATPILNVEDVFVSEGGTATFVLRLSQPAAVAASVQYLLPDQPGERGTAYLSSLSEEADPTPRDLNVQSGRVDFAVGDTVKTIVISTTVDPNVPDTEVEPAESFIMQFLAPVNLTLGRTYAVGTIIDNDTVSVAPLVSVSDVYVNESSGTAVFNITLLQASASQITVNYQTASLGMV